ncbi:MAG: DUF1501 domain-containing protein [Gammaproteobacteria bacterium]|nr:DUF1501 domain-containing protein [Gammaproteobacteria bacterium]
MKRRDFLKNSLLTLLGTQATVGAGLFSSQAVAATQSKKTLVVIFQRGGCDGLNTCVPYGDDLYYSLRPTIAVPPPDGLDPTSAVDLNGFFGLHPGLASLKQIYDAGDMAVFPAVHYPQGEHSHFDSQYFVESAISKKGFDGWMNRYLTNTVSANNFRAVALDNSLPQILKGETPVSAFADLEEMKLNLNADYKSEVMLQLEASYFQMSRNHYYSKTLQGLGQRLITDLGLLQDASTSGYVAANGALYPNTEYGKQLKQVSQLIKLDLGVEVIAVSSNGWDTHINQGGGESGGRQYNLHQEFSDGIAALYQDLGDKMNDVVILTCTEFGRTVKENGGKGTDHGNGSSWFMFGKSINGGIHGDWPGLNADQLLHGRYLNFSVDYRNIIGDILLSHLSVPDISPILLEHSYTPLGLFV